MNEPAPSGPGKGFMNSKKELDEMLDKYYGLHGWDLETSWPREPTLRELGLEDVGNELRKLNRLPK
jgi:aldehyde:ferredoxin oxidoreductase